MTRTHRAAGRIAPVQPIVENKPGRSPAARVLAPALRNATWLLRHTRTSPRGLPPIAALTDSPVGVMQPAMPGTRTKAVQFGGFRGELVTAPGVRADDDRVVLYFHGGAFFCCGLRSHRRLVSRISAAAGVPVLNVGYRQLPVATLAQSVADGVHAYQLLLLRGHDPSKVVLAGDSAGGYLAFAVALQAHEQGLPAPAGIATLSPWLDLDGRYSHEHPNGSRDPYLPMQLINRLLPLLYGGSDPLPSLLDDADLSVLPPSLIQVGSVEALLSDAEQMTGRLAAAGVPVRLQIWQRQIHVFQALADFMPEAQAAIRDLAEFILDAVTPAEADHRTDAAA